MSMTYSPEEIMEAARYYGEMERICTGYDLIIENYADRAFYAFDEDTYTEAVSDVIESMISKVAAIFKTIMDFIAKQIDKVDNFVNGKKYERLMSPEMKAKFDEVSAGKQVMGVDVVKLHKLQKESEKFIDKFTMVVNGELQKASTEVTYDNTRLKSYMENSQKSYKTLTDEIKKVSKTKVPLTKADFYKMVKEGISANTDMKAFKKKMSRTQKQLTDTLRKLQKSKVLKESVNDVIFTEGEGEGFFAKVKNTFMQAINAIKNFIIEHARICEYICMAMTVVFGGSAKVFHYGRDEFADKSFAKEDDLLYKYDLSNYEKDGKPLTNLNDLFESWLKKYMNEHSGLNSGKKKALSDFKTQEMYDRFLADPSNRTIIMNGISEKIPTWNEFERDMRELKYIRNTIDDYDKKRKMNTAAAGVSAVGAMAFKKIADDRIKNETK